MILEVELTQAQYDRYQAALTKIQGASEPVTDAQLVAQMKREAAAITYAAEIGNGDGAGWGF